MKALSVRKFSLLLVLTILLGSIAYYAIVRQKTVPANRAGELSLRYPAKDKLVFFALGDTGSGNSAQMATAATMEQTCQKLGGIDGIFLLGDNFYPSGIRSTTDEQWKKKVEEPYGTPCLSSGPIFAVLGNHDYKGDVQVQIDYSALNARWKMPYRFYSVDFGDLLRVVAFDSGFPDVCLSSESCSIDFLWSRLKDSDKVWNFAMGHHPITSGSSMGHGYAGGLFGMLMQPLVCAYADTYLSGHAHHLEHRRLPGCKTDFLISGGGGGDLYKVKHNEGSLFDVSKHGFVQIDVSKEVIEFQFIGMNGEPLHRAEKRKGKASN